MKHILPFRIFEFKAEDTDLVCKICGAKMYMTDIGGTSKTYHCSSDEAKFWNFLRGSKEEKIAHKHFYDSTINLS